MHGDDLTTSGPTDQLDWCKRGLEKHYELTEADRLGPGAKDDKEARVLNRIVRWTSECLEYEAGPRQAEKLPRKPKLNGQGVKGIGTPGAKAIREQNWGGCSAPCGQGHSLQSGGGREQLLVSRHARVPALGQRSLQVN